ncbi:ABC transporter ATP-binding protein [Gemmatimonas sp.]|jgi:Cu-processing system ATP-binding protein|uniref:ABC transporter ATP-binding protein n=1 Tax=Gemmatimonas sp. TaxID=1962908 RepID=UPI0037BE9C82
MSTGLLSRPSREVRTPTTSTIPLHRPATPLVEIRALVKSFGRRCVLDRVDLDIARGAVTAIIGPNGAGKTTLNKVLLGLMHADSGRIAFDGVEIAGQIAYRARIGYMPQAARFPESYTGQDVLDLLRDLRGETTPHDVSLLHALGVEAFLAQTVRTLSGGQRQRLNAVAAFLFAPDLLLLDEPTAGLDPIASGRLKEKIRAVRDEGRAVIITSHILSELQEISDTVVFLHEGRVRWSGPLAQLMETTGATSLERAIACLMQPDTDASGADV